MAARHPWVLVGTYVRQHDNHTRRYDDVYVNKFSMLLLDVPHMDKEDKSHYFIEGFQTLAHDIRTTMLVTNQLMTPLRGTKGAAIIMNEGVHY
ncbi:unnamed protein product [Spirodela intermedia]|uniref:Uncharacterized protein n=2 Tax=Spirodela intermedia TaxID=51605 RepID=A0A7I8IKE8_SPIIN|nr:unnamed protein product [Spirodela intermedia]CAA6658331.1 unnamed protein product [Spirodela intermedia]CAA7394532.1 unnamed protein product [Spirodela intermedia]